MSGRIGSHSSSVNVGSQCLEKLNIIIARNAKLFPSIKHVDTNELQNMRTQIRESMYIVDVRTDAERMTSKLPASISRSEFEMLDWSEVNKNNAVIVAYCTVGYRSGMYCKKLEEKGFREVFNYEGILSWIHNGGILVDSHNETVKVVHTFGKQWDLTPDGYDSVHYSTWNVAWMSVQYLFNEYF